MQGVACPAGYFCIGSAALPAICGGGAGRYCPLGSGTSTGLACMIGYYCTGAAAAPVACACGVGKYCALGSTASTSCVSCPLGLFCAGMSDGPVPVRCTASLGGGYAFNLTALMATGATAWVYTATTSESYYLNFCASQPAAGTCLGGAPAAVCQVRTP
jgi:hypothetical protein